MVQVTQCLYYLFTDNIYSPENILNMGMTENAIVYFTLICFEHHCLMRRDKKDCNQSNSSLIFKKAGWP